VPAHILGQIEHATIQQFLSAFKVNTQPNENLFLETALKEVRKNCFENQFNWGEELIQKISIQVLNECFETSAIFWNLKISYPHIKFYFEYKFSNKFQLHLNGERTDDILVEGSIDCLAKVDEKWFLFDFKRSGSSIPNQSEIDRLKKVQLHFYLNFIDIPIEDIIFYGFISLRDFSESLIYSASHTVEYSQFPFATKSGSPQKEVESFKEEFLKILGNMGHDLNYFPVVSREDYCNYCEFKNICPKMKIN